MTLLGYLGASLSRKEQDLISRAAVGAKRITAREKAAYQAWESDPKRIEELDRIIAATPDWERFEGEWILRSANRPVAALPVTGRKNAANFIVFDLTTRERITQLKNTEVDSWLIREAKSAMDP